MASLFPTTEEDSQTTNIVAPETTRVSFGKSWSFDFETGEFVQTTTGKVQEADTMGAWVEWCVKAISTSRYRYLAYSRDYGEEYTELIGKVYPRTVAESEIKRMTIDCLSVDPRTKKVENFSFSWDDDAVTFTCEITNILGNTATIGGKMVIPA